MTTQEHIEANYKAFLKTYPEYTDTVMAVSHALYHEIKRRALPHNEDCLEFINGALRLEETLSGDDYQAYQEISGYTEPCAHEQNEEICRKISLADMPPLSERMTMFASQQTLKHIRIESQGLTTHTRKAVTNMLARDHLESIAEITREATLFAMLDEECAQLPDVISELISEGLPHELTPAQLYNTLFMHISDQFANHVTDQVRTMMANPPVSLPEPVQARTLQDILKKFDF
jgi:hypothetical protein